MNENKFNIESPICENFVYNFKNITDFRKEFKKQFKYIIAYHATNLSINELNNVNKYGLKLTSKKLLVKKAKDKFISNVNHQIVKEIENYFNENENELPTLNQINFGLIKSHLIEDHYHYLLFGSETLLKIADLLKRKYNKSFRQLLVESGSHYIIKAKIPVCKIDDKWIDAIYESFFEALSEISLVYYNNLPAKNLIIIKKIERPIDRNDLMLI